MLIAMHYFKPNGSPILLLAENRRGELLIFEADNTAVVHNMDSPELFPYKVPQMRKVFEAFAAMLHRRAGDGREPASRFNF